MPEPIRFRLRDLIIVMVLLTLVAAIFIVPAVLRSRMASNETSAVAALKQLVSTESTRRGTDSDGNGFQDYWTLDISGFYGMQDQSGAMLKFIDIGFARADASRRVSYAGKPSPNGGPCRPVPKSGYTFRSMLSDDNAGQPTPYCVNYVRTQKNITVLRNSKGVYGYATATNSYLFGFEAIPVKYQTTGIRVFIVCEEGVIYGVDKGDNAFVATWPGTDPTAKMNNGRFWAVVQ